MSTLQFIWLLAATTATGTILIGLIWEKDWRVTATFLVLLSFAALVATLVSKWNS